MMETKTLEITKEDAEACLGYWECEDCMIATAAKRQFKTDTVMVGSATIHINDERLRMRGSITAGSLNYNHALRRAYDHKELKRLDRFKPFSIELTKCD